MICCNIMSNISPSPDKNINYEIYNKQLAKAKQKRGNSMCMPLMNIRGKTASEILHEVGVSGEIPVPLNPILRHYGISAMPYDFTELEKSEELVEFVAERGKILGIIISKDDYAGIFYRDSDTSYRQRFTIAHELGHCANAEEDIAEFIEFRQTVASDNVAEIAANTFAVELLMPEEKLRALYGAMPIPYASLLAKAFAVSDNVMKARMKGLRLKYV
ncbi:MAG: ImmA/IrrE family metallo-endopeptidase [Defluviitaleaceae bacterium]|nr:ImmA/IrrE family metallo-endopeptidase [Defluviitaleaceae bacterium]